MSLIGKTIKIMVNEPFDREETLSGMVMSDLGDKLLVKLKKPIKGHALTSDLIELKPRCDKETFEKLVGHAVTVDGSLIKEKASGLDYFLIGSITLN